MTKWLEGFSLELKNEIFETDEWVKYALSNSHKDGMPDNNVKVFGLLLQDIIENTERELIEEYHQIKLYSHSNSAVSILYLHLCIEAKDYIVLYAGSHIESQKEHWEISKINANDFLKKLIYNLDNISRNAYRSYPKWTVSNDDLWFTIEKSKEVSNLSLTTEQSNFFKNFKFPYYINAQAGSGKSTMLYYLFANIYYYKYLDEIEGDIVFLTENEKLLENTKNNVYELLNSNAEFDGLTIEMKNENENYFYSFKEFLLNLLDENDLKNFPNDKYLHFSEFKSLYESSNLPKYTLQNYSAEESWFTIITYIYGYTLEETVTSVNYENNIDKKSLKISLEKFKGIEEKVLPFYEKLLDDGYWDKLKIIRYINENINLDLKQKYEVIVCDEAQDFCKVELQFILRMSEYLKYDISNIPQIPILFAGDSNQTVNPTGFRQDEMTSLLYEELKEIANFNYDSTKNLYNPSFNYRSSHPVVALANFIQYYRMQNLSIEQDKPQEAKRPIADTDKNFNIFLDYESIENDENLKNSLLKKLKYKVFIVPVDANEKDEYKNKYELLQSMEDVELKTSIEAKGAEYKQVVLYGFGEYYLNQFKSIEEELNEDDKFKMSYFFNKLYVGITRAQTELIIIDSVDSKDKFWNKIVNNTEINRPNWKSLNDLKNQTIKYNPSSINNMIIQSTKIDAFSNAESDKKEGIYHNNSARLSVAGSQFFKLGKDKEAYECLALAEEIKYNYKGAGEYFLKSENIENIEKASIAYFRGRFFDDVEKIGNNLKTVNQDIRMIIARVMDKEILISKEIDSLSRNKDSLYTLIKDLDWKDELIKRFLTIFKKIEEIELKREFVAVVKYIALSTDMNSQKEIANIYYNLNEYKKAVDIWESIDVYEEVYFLSKIELSKEIVKKHKRDSEIPEDEALTIYLSYIYVESLDAIVAIGALVEEKFQHNLAELEEFYQNIVQIPNLEKKKYLYLLERWAKVYYKIDENGIEELNSNYKVFNKNIPYKAFTKNELENISNLPKIKDKSNVEHFSNIRIKNFRQFKNIEIEDIGQFNLILGDNNVGKTSLLEALLFSTDSELFFKNLIFSYASRMNSLEFKNPNDFILDIIHKDSQSKEIQFELKSNREVSNFTIKIPTEEEVKNSYPNTENIDVTNYICIVDDDNKCDMKPLSSILKQSKNSDLIQTQFIPFGKGFDKDVVKIYAENIDRNKLKRKEFLESMKVFIPNIDRITTDTDEGRIYIEEKGVENDSSLHQYGEGAKKLFRILVQITLQKGKKLLIDEIDAGIHHSHFNEFWKIILKVAKINNVQIFATTHNMECIEYFKEVLEEENMKGYQELSRTLTLEKVFDNNIKVYTRTFEEFEYEIDNELDIRGVDL
ncbi:MAG: AAA family ATPase [Sulfurovum sp.]|nr:AAA family ATPase [Sulfurovum sp.]